MENNFKNEMEKLIKLMPNISLYYSSRSEILDLLGYRNEALKDAFMAATLKKIIINIK